MRFSLSIFVTVVAFLTTAIYQQDNLLHYMRAFHSKAVNNFSKAVSTDSKITMSKTETASNNSKVFNRIPHKSFSAMAPNSSFIGLPVVPPDDPSLNAKTPKPRAIQNVVFAREQSEGAGATVRRSIGGPKLKNFTPFLLCDHFDSYFGTGGFPDHPHRGQETITYLLKGGFMHEDFTGNAGTLRAGDLQFMTAGRGIVHAEMPLDNEEGTSNAGMQIWVDLPKDLKDCEPRYRDLKASEIPTVDVDDGKVHVKVISGRSHGVDSIQELAYTPVWLLDVSIKPGGKITQSLPAGWNAFAYTLEGTTSWDTGATSQEAPQFYNTIFEQKGDQVIASVPADAKEGTRFILVAGLPLSQPIFQYGPFVLTEASQVRQAMMDYSTFTNGFERAENWQSEIGKAVVH